jgi:pimeloyl-ACP methyl ester carboxylesterase
VKRVPSGRSEVALHELRAGAGPTLLALHALGGSSRDFTALAAHWPGRVLALDFAGHGDSDWTRGGSYTPELYAADADSALPETGEVHLAGAGLGAYVALLLAGTRPARVASALLLPGRGLDGAGAAPSLEPAAVARRNQIALGLLASTSAGRPAFDPMAVLCELDPRPPDYARQYADAARRLLLAEDGAARPPWWEAARGAARAERAPADAADAFRRLVAGSPAGAAGGRNGAG